MKNKLNLLLRTSEINNLHYQAVLICESFYVTRTGFFYLSEIRFALLLHLSGISKFHLIKIKNGLLAMTAPSIKTVFFGL